MTKVEKHFRLQRPLDEVMMERIAGVNSIYGIEHVTIARSREDLLIAYDASRLSAGEVEAALQRAGIPVVEIVNGEAVIA